MFTFVSILYLASTLVVEVLQSESPYNKNKVRNKCYGKPETMKGGKNTEVIPENMSISSSIHVALVSSRRSLTTL